MRAKKIIKEVQAFSGFVAITSFIVGLAACYMVASPGSHPLAMDVMVASMVAFSASFVLWAILSGLTADDAGGTLGGGGLPWRL